MNIPKPKKQKPVKKDDKSQGTLDLKKSYEKTEEEPAAGLPDVDFKKFLGCGG